MSDAAFGGFLVRQGLLLQDRLQQALETQGAMNVRLDTVLLDTGALIESEILASLALFHKSRPVTGAELVTTAASVAGLVSPRMAARYEIVPFHLEGKKLSVATLNPGDLLVEDELGLLTGCMVSTFVTLELRMYEALARLYGVQPPRQLALVARRLAGSGDDRSPRMRPGAAAAGPRRAVRAPVNGPAFSPSLATRASRPHRPTEASELEISNEDLELFPSLRELSSVTSAVGDEEQRPPAPGSDAAPVTTPAATQETKTVPAAAPPDPMIAASMALENAEMREDIADALLAFCQPHFRRRMMLVTRKGTVMGWCGEGEGVDSTAIRGISIPLSDPSVFVGLSQGQSFWLGALPPMPRNLELVLALGAPTPPDCVILPVTLRDKTICFLYGDNLDASVSGAPMADLRRLVAKAGLAFQVYIMRSKIRTL